jgi:hypothetical protein
VVGYTPIIPAFRKQRQEDYKFEDSLGWPFLKQTKKPKKKKKKKKKKEKEKESQMWTRAILPHLPHALPILLMGICCSCLLTNPYRASSHIVTV